MTPVERPFRTPEGVDYLAIQQSAEFRQLRLHMWLLQWGLIITGFLLMLTTIWFGAYRPDLMTVPLLGAVNGAVLSAMVLATGALALVGLYMWIFSRHLDPRIDQLRDRAGVDPE
jgi:uncharacterized membrane protein (DUF485 family)